MVIQANILLVKEFQKSAAYIKTTFMHMIKDMLMITNMKGHYC